MDDQRGLPDLRRPPGGRRAGARGRGSRPRGVWHVAAGGDCTWADFAEAIFEEAGLRCNGAPDHAPRSSGALRRRPAYSVLRSERPGAPVLPHWRDGLRACLARDGRASLPAMRLLVTGGAGFIGSNFVHYWLDRYPDDHLVVYDLLTYAGNRESLVDVEDRIVFVHGDICDRELGGGARSATSGSRSSSTSPPSPTTRSPSSTRRDSSGRTSSGRRRSSMPSRAAGVERFHHVSTCEVYGDLPLDTDEVFTEESPYRPRTPYNASKAGADHAVRAYFETFGLPVTITNCSNNYGPYQFPEKVDPALHDERARRPAPPDVRLHAEQARVAARPRPLRGDRPRPRGGRAGETYNVGSGVEATIEEIADLVLRAHRASPTRSRRSSPTDPATTAGTSSTPRRSARSSAGSRHTAWDDGLAETVEWYAANRAWWEPLKARAPVEESAWR